MGSFRLAMALGSVALGAATPPYPLTQKETAIVMGSSSEMGKGTGTGPDNIFGARANGYWIKAFERLAANGVPTSSQDSYGAHGLTSYADLAPYDTRFTYTGMTISGNTTLGGLYLVHPTTGANELTFTPTIPVDAFEIEHFNTAAATLYASVDGGAEQTIVLDGTGGIIKTTVNTTLGAHTLKIRGPNPTTGTANTLGIRAFNSAAIELRALVAGIAGANTNDWYASTTIYAPMSMLKRLAPTYAIFVFGGNETFTSTASLQNFINRYRVCVWAALAAGSKPIFVLKPFTTDTPDVPSGSNVWSPRQIQNAVIALATEVNAPYYDMNIATGSWASVQAAGEVVDSTPHYNSAWHLRVGNAIGDWLNYVALPFLKNWTPPVTIIQDSLAGADGEALANRVAQRGGIIEVANPWVIANNAAYGTTNASFLRVNPAPYARDVAVKSRMTFKSTGIANRLSARRSGTDNNLYYGGYENGQGWRVGRRVSGTNTAINTVAFTPTAGMVKDVEFRCYTLPPSHPTNPNLPMLELWVDGVLAVSGVDTTNAFPNGGECGIYDPIAMTATTGVHNSNFSVERI